MNRVLAHPSRSFFAFNKTVNFPWIIAMSSNDFYFFIQIYVLNLLSHFAEGALQLCFNATSCSFVSLRSRRFASSLSAEKKSLIAEGPSLGEFISGEVSPQENPYKRKKGQRYIPYGKRSNICCILFGATAEYPGEIEAGGRASRLRVKFLWWKDDRTRQFFMFWLRVYAWLRVKMRAKSTGVRSVLSWQFLIIIIK